MYDPALSEEYHAVLKKLDIFNLVIILALGFATFPLAFVVYFKLLTIDQFKENFTFRLIVIAGVVDFLVYIANLVFLQLSTFIILNNFFDFLNETGLSPIVSDGLFLLCFLQVLLSLSVAVNRLLFIAKNHLLQMHGRLVFFCSIVASIGFSAVFSVIAYQPSFTFARTYIGAGVYAHSPSGGELPSYLAISLLTLSVSTTVFLVSLSLARSVFTYRRQISNERGRSLENGLIIVAISNFVNYILFLGGIMIGTYCNIPIFNYSVCVLISLVCVSPFWCLFLFGKSMRRAIFTRSSMNGIIPSVSSNSES